MLKIGIVCLFVLMGLGLFPQVENQLGLGYSTIDKGDFKPVSYSVVKTYPLAFLVGPSVLTSEFGLCYDFSLPKNMAINIGGAMLTKNALVYLSELSQGLVQNNNTNNVTYTAPKLKISGYKIQGQFKFLFPVFNTYPSGLFIGPHASFSTFFIGDAVNGFNRDYYRIVFNNISILSGYQQFIKNKIFFEIYNGIGYKKNYAVFHKNTTSFKFVENEFALTGSNGNLKISFGLTLGMVF